MNDGLKFYVKGVLNVKWRETVDDEWTAREYKMEGVEELWSEGYKDACAVFDDAICYPSSLLGPTAYLLKSQNPFGAHTEENRFERLMLDEVMNTIEHMAKNVYGAMEESDYQRTKTKFERQAIIKVNYNNAVLDVSFLAYFDTDTSKRGLQIKRTIDLNQWR